MAQLTSISADLTDWIFHVPESSVTEALRAAPPALHVVAVVGIVAGLVLWLKGASALKPMLLLIFGVIGAVIGAFIGASQGALIEGVPSPYIGMLIGSIAGVVGVLLLLRVAIAASTAAACAGGALLLASAFFVSQPNDSSGLRTTLDAPIVTPAASNELDRARAAAQRLRNGESLTLPVRSEVSAMTTASGWSSESKQTTPTAAGDAAALTRHLLNALGQAGGSWWERVPFVTRVVLIAVTLLGGALGLLYGASYPKRAMIALSAAVGSGVGLICLTWMSIGLDLRTAGILGVGPFGLLMVWFILAMIGVLWQWLNDDKEKTAPVAGAVRTARAMSHAAAVPHGGRSITRP